ncbi:hypothetical protein HYQ46_003186 [Verticillium longisporum]|nr:hypothetical protein HYQ46_003186 [Verticillium longisporum]
MTTTQDPTIAVKSPRSLQEGTPSSSLGSHSERQQQTPRLPKEGSQHLESTSSDRRPAADTSFDLPIRDAYTEGRTHGEGEAAQAPSVSPEVAAVEILRPCVDLSRSTTIIARPEDWFRDPDSLSIKGLGDILSRQGYRLRTETQQAPRNDMVNAGIGPVIIATSKMAASLPCRDESFLSLSSYKSTFSHVTRRSTDGTDKTDASEAFTSASRASTMASAASSDCSCHVGPFVNAIQPMAELVVVADQNHVKDNETPLSSNSMAQKLLYRFAWANPHGRCDKQHLRDENEGSRRPRPPSLASSQAWGRRSQLDQHVNMSDVPDALATLGVTVENQSTEQTFNGVSSLSLPVKRKTSTP